jgi:uracil phosphoribosyltransferase
MPEGICNVGIAKNEYFFLLLHNKKNNDMKVVNFARANTILNQYVAEIRDVHYQNNRWVFRRNIERIGELMAYEISKQLSYSEKQIQTPLDTALANTPDDKIVLATVFRAGLPLHQGFLNIFDRADNAFVSAFRYYEDKEGTKVGIKTEYMAAPDLRDKTLILVDPMLATGGSMELAYKALAAEAEPKNLILASVIAAQEGVNYLKKVFRSKNVTLYTAAIDPKLNEHKYIVPGLGDAGDLCYGEKL